MYQHKNLTWDDFGAEKKPNIPSFELLAYEHLLVLLILIGCKFQRQRLVDQLKINWQLF